MWPSAGTVIVAGMAFCNVHPVMERHRQGNIPSNDSEDSDFIRHFITTYSRCDQTRLDVTNSFSMHLSGMTKIMTPDGGATEGNGPFTPEWMKRSLR